VLRDDGLRAALESVLEAPVSDLVRLSGGASRQTWAFRSGGRDLILQRDRPGGVRTGGGIAAEADLLVHAAAGGVPVPRVVCTGGPDSPVGAAFVISERIPGETIPRRLLRDPAVVGAGRDLVAAAGGALARVHRLDPGPVAGILDEIDQVEQFRAILDGFDEPSPAFELAFRWLDRHRPPTRPTVVVHGDFRLGNLVIDGARLAAVLDWELAHLGNPAEDLGWFCVRAWRFGSPLRAGGLGDLEDLLSGYREAGGEEIDPEEVRWWEVLGTLKWGIMCMIQAATHLSGVSRSVELAAIGRRVSECEWDVLELIR
jgi:aminoglycoside phosphotransferase (APT) family kinase protein